MSQCHRCFTAKLFINCVLTASLTSGHVILVPHWSCVRGPNGIWKRKHCSFTWTVRLNTSQEWDKKKLIILEFITRVNLETKIYHLSRNMVIKGQELRWKVKQWVWNGGSVAPVSSRGGVGVFSMKMKGLSWLWSLNHFSVLWDTSKKPFGGRWYKWDSLRSDTLTAWLDVEH